MSEPILAAIENSALAVHVRESVWLFPTVETVHVIALTLVLGTIIRVDLRLLGLADRDRPFSSFSRGMLPWTWASFGVAAIAGGIMFAAKAAVYAANTPFQVKMGLMLLAGINMGIFHLMGMRHIQQWDAQTPPWNARLSGAISLLLWAAIVASGRWIGFTTL